MPVKIINNWRLILSRQVDHNLAIKREQREDLCGLLANIFRRVRLVDHNYWQSLTSTSASCYTTPLIYNKNQSSKIPYLSFHPLNCSIIFLFLLELFWVFRRKWPIIPQRFYIPIISQKNLKFDNDKSLNKWSTLFNSIIISFFICTVNYYGDFLYVAWSVVDIRNKLTLVYDL